MSRTVCITGVTRGLGHAMAHGFAAAGHTVAGCGRTPTKIAHLVTELPEPHDFSIVDVADDASVEAWASRVLERIGPPDLLVNNAALINENAPLWEVPPEEFSRVVDVNVKGVYHVIRHFLPAMAARGRGVIVNVSSGWGRSTAPDVGPYCTTKWAVEGLTSALADEIPSGLAAVSLNPGVIDTLMLRTCWGDAAASYGTPDAWATTAVPFLLGLGPEDNGKALTAP